MIPIISNISSTRGMVERTSLSNLPTLLVRIQLYVAASLLLSYAPACCDSISPILSHFSNPAQAIGTQDHDLHRVRRSALNLYFSKKAVQDLVPSIQQVIEKLCDRLRQAAESGEILNMKYFFNAATLDIITEYCFSRPAGNLSKPDFGRKSFDDVDSFVEVSLWVRRGFRARGIILIY